MLLCAGQQSSNSQRRSQNEGSFGHYQSHICWSGFVLPAWHGAASLKGARTGAFPLACLCTANKSTVFNSLTAGPCGES